MQINIPTNESLKKEVKSCLINFWGIREGGVLHGKTMDAFEQIIKKYLTENGVSKDHIVNGRKAKLPGYFRASKNWDIVVYKPLEDGRNLLLAAIEMKSMFGSVGNNLNNRSEEAIGSAYDLQQANTRLHLSGSENTFGRPFVGYVYVLGEHGDNKKGSLIDIPLFSSDDIFTKKDSQGNSIPENYETRLEILISRLIESELYTSGTFIIADTEQPGEYIEPNSEIGFYQFIAKMLGEVITRYHVSN